MQRAPAWHLDGASKQTGMRRAAGSMQQGCLAAADDHADHGCMHVDHALCTARWHANPDGRGAMVHRRQHVEAASAAMQSLVINIPNKGMPATRTQGRGLTQGTCQSVNASPWSLLACPKQTGLQAHDGSSTLRLQAGLKGCSCTASTAGLGLACSQLPVHTRAPSLPPDANNATCSLRSDTTGPRALMTGTTVIRTNPRSCTHPAIPLS
jgi:hypothetical protein